MTKIIYFDYDSIRGYYCDGSMFINIERGNIKVSGSDGNDSIYNGYYSNILINGGAGDDEISNSGSNVLFNLLAREFPRLYRRWDESRIDNRHFFAKIKLLENKE